VKTGVRVAATAFSDIAYNRHKYMIATINICLKNNKRQIGFHE